MRKAEGRGGERRVRLFLPIQICLDVRDIDIVEYVVKNLVRSVCGALEVRLSNLLEGSQKVSVDLFESWVVTKLLLEE